MRIKNRYEFTYIINEDEKCVVCLATPKTYDGKLYGLLAFATQANHFCGGNKFYPNLYASPYTFKGIARYKTNDKFDVETAKKIARAKVLRQANGVMAELLTQVYGELATVQNEIQKYQKGTTEKKQEYIDRIAELTKPE